MVAGIVERLRRSEPATLRNMEDMMIKRFNKAALARMSDAELQFLHRRTFDALLASDPLTVERRDALIALDLIEIEYGSRHVPSP